MSESACTGYTIPPGTFSYVDESGVRQILDITNVGVYGLGCNNESDFLTLPINAFLNSNQETFHESIVAILYTISGATAFSWLMLLLLLISRAKRPWLQKLSTLFSALALSITLNNTSDILQVQYSDGYQDADELRQNIVRGTTFQTMGAVAIFLLWLAHTQIAERLFPRNREKMAIRTIGVSLATADLIFRLIGYFVFYQKDGENGFGNPFYLLSYIIELCLAVAYATIVLLYSLKRRQYAYQGKAIMVGIMSFTSILLSIVFITLSMVVSWISGWAPFVNLSLYALALIVVWSWIDLIELKEKQEQMTGIMGRVIYEPKLVEDFETMSGHGKASGTHVGKSSAHHRHVSNMLPIVKKSLFLFSLPRGESAASAGTRYDSPQAISNNENIVPVTNPSPADADMLNYVKSRRSSKLERISYPVKKGTIIPSRTDSTQNEEQLDQERRTTPRARIRTRPVAEISSGNNRVSSHDINRGSITSDNVNSDTDAEFERPNIVNVSTPNTTSIPVIGPSIGSPFIHEYDNSNLQDVSPEEPPNVFNRIPGYDPGDYWDDKDHQRPT